MDAAGDGGKGFLCKRLTKECETLRPIDVSAVYCSSRMRLPSH